VQQIEQALAEKVLASSRFPSYQVTALPHFHPQKWEEGYYSGGVGWNFII
jgi:hypothetical protein